VTQLIADRYRLDQHLASINNSEFYNGFDTETEQSVIVRMIDLTQGDEKTQAKLQRFMQNETRLRQTLNHPLMLKVLDSGVQDTTYYHVNEFLPFKTLRDVITQTPCDLRTALQYGRDLADSLAQFHAMDLIHCDIKPENVLVTDNGLKLMEFSITNHETMPEGHATGTPEYMSPEAARGEPFAPARDIWALGTLIYELIAGHIPYHLAEEQRGPGQAYTLFRKILQEPVPPLEEIVPKLPPRLIVLIDSMLEKEAAKRIASMSDVKRELDLILSGLSIS
jgi:eukaryotic-like serine/threonine-protein kinase